MRSNAAREAPPPEEEPHEEEPVEGPEDDIGYHSAASEATSTTMSPTQQEDYICLGEAACRANMTTSVGGIRVPVICTRQAANCGYHMRKREEGNVQPVGAYLSMRPPGKATIYGSSPDTRITLEAYEALGPPSDEDLNEIAEALRHQPPAEEPAGTGADLEGNPESEPVEATPTLFFSETEERTTPRSSGRNPTASAKRHTPIEKHHETTPPKEQVTVTSSPSDMWYGLEDNDAHRHITSDSSMLNSVVSSGLMTLKRTFRSHAEAKHWKESEVIPVDDVEAPHLVPQRSTDPIKGKEKKKEKPRRRRKETRKLKRRECSSDSEDSASNSSSDSSIHSIPSSSSSGLSDSSSFSDRQPRKKTRDRRLKKGRRSKKEVKRQEKDAAKLLSVDSSTGVNDQVHGMNINDNRLVRATAPPEMLDRDTKQLYEFAVDVVSLPGRYQSSDMSAMDDAERMTKLMSSAMSKGRSSKGDLLWNTSQRHPLGKVKSKEDFLSLVAEVVDTKASAFEQQDNQISSLMSRCEYSSQSIKRYLVSGGLCTLVRNTYQLYLELLYHIQGMMTSSTGGWKESQGRSVLEYHSNKLLRIRSTAYDRKNMLFRFYVYLRDAREKKFTDISLINQLWKQLEAPAPSATDKPKTRSGDQPDDADIKPQDNCPHCRLGALHHYLRRGMYKNSCPLKDYSQGDARKAAHKLLALKCNKPKEALADLIKQAVESQD